MNNKSVSELLIVDFPFLDNLLHILIEVSNTRVDTSIRIGLIFHILHFSFFKDNV